MQIDYVIRVGAKKEVHGVWARSGRGWGNHRLSSFGAVGGVPPRWQSQERHTNQMTGCEATENHAYGTC